MENISDSSLAARPLSKWFVISILTLSIIGIVDSVYLAVKHYTHSDINCSIFSDCDVVTTSVYSIILGIPVALLGVIFYGLIFILVLMFSKSGNRRSLISLSTVSGIGFLASMWFVYVQAFILNAFCFYCLISALLSTVLFILSIIIMIQYKKHATLS